MSPAELLENRYVSNTEFKEVFFFKKEFVSAFLTLLFIGKTDLIYWKIVSGFHNIGLLTSPHRYSDPVISSHTKALWNAIRSSWKSKEPVNLCNRLELGRIPGGDDSMQPIQQVLCRVIRYNCCLLRKIQEPWLISGNQRGCSLSAEQGQGGLSTAIVPSSDKLLRRDCSQVIVSDSSVTVVWEA
jgi:hypothetical protein